MRSKMKPRKHIPKNLRNVLSKLHQLIDQKRIIRGTTYWLRNTCGKKNCKCAQGDKHVSLYIRKSIKGESSTMLIPKSRWDDVIEMNNRYKEILRLLTEISEYEWGHLKDKN